MVVISELNSVFWGVTLESNKQYVQKTERPVHISMAALDPFQQHDTNPVAVIFERDGSKYVLCSLQYGSNFQQPLNLEFAAGEDITFFLKGKGVVHLTGYIMPEDDFPGFDQADFEEEELSESDEDNDVPLLVNKRSKPEDKTSPRKAAKKARMMMKDEKDDDDDSDDEDFLDDEASEDDMDDDDDDDDDDTLEKDLLDEDDDDDDDDEEDSDDDESSSKKKPVTKKSTGDQKKTTPGKAAVKTEKSKPTPNKTNEQKSETQTSSPQVAQEAGAVEGKKKRKKKKKNKNKNQLDESAQPQRTDGVRS